VPVLEANISACGLGDRVGQVRASDVPVLALGNDPKGAADQVIAEILEAEQNDDVQTVVLGCGGMVGIEAQAKQRTNIRLIDGVRAAAHIASGL